MNDDTEEIGVSLLMRQSPEMWMENCGVIRLGSGRIAEPGTFRSNILQRRIFALQKARRAAGKACYAVGLKPRKKGFSTAVAALHYTTMAGQPCEGVIVGNKLETSDTVYRMVALFAERDRLAKEGEWSSNVKVGAESMKWLHNSTLTLSTAHGKESIRGQTPQFVHGTEVAHWEQEDDVFLAVMNAVPDDPNVSVWLESTPKGRGGAFHSHWQGARWPTPEECPPEDAEYWKQWEAKCPDQPEAFFAEWEFVRVFAAWFEFEEAALKLTQEQKLHIQATLDEKAWYHGERSLIEAYGQKNAATDVTRLGRVVVESDIWEQLAWRRMTIQKKCKSDPLKFDQEYPRDPHSCFLASGRPVFDGDALEHYAATIITPEFGMLDSNIASEQTDKGGEAVTWRLQHREDAIFSRWEAPRIGCRYLIVLDTAEGSDQAGGRDPDRHSCLVLRRAYTGTDGVPHVARVVARIRPPCNVPIHVLVEWVHRLHLHYGALVIVEMNSSGLAYITGARMRGTPLWKRVDPNPRSGKKEEKLGWRTTDTADYGGLRTAVIDRLGEILRDRALDVHCAQIVHELGCFVDKHGRKEAESGEHDDDVLALAIGMYKIDAALVYAEAAVERTMPGDLRAILEGVDHAQGLNAHKW